MRGSMFFMLGLLVKGCCAVTKLLSVAVAVVEANYEHEHGLTDGRRIAGPLVAHTQIHSESLADLPVVLDVRIQPILTPVAIGVHGITGAAGGRIGITGARSSKFYERAPLQRSACVEPAGTMVCRPSR